jgi:DNA-binding LytR/AlgR family response regulator
MVSSVSDNRPHTRQSMISCIIIEDQLPAQRILQKYISDAGQLELLNTFSDALKAIDFLKSHQVDLMLLDIHLPKISGIEFLKTIAHPPQVILTTAFSDYALESYDLNVVDYLLKPFSFQRFIQAVAKVKIDDGHAFAKAESTQSISNPLDIYIKSGYDHIRVQYRDIALIKSDADYTEVHTTDRKIISTEPLKHWENTLPVTIFYRVHKSYIINTDFIIKISGNRIHLKTGEAIPMGRAYKNEFTDKFLK